MALSVAAVSGSRADFGPLRPLLIGLRDDKRMHLSTIVCAVGSAEEAGRQLVAFEDSSLSVDVTITAGVVAGGVSGPSPMTHQAARALEGVAEALQRLRPDLLVLLGDRFEIMAAALAAHLQRVPIVHLSGGDETLGSLDDAMRHAISRLASLHLPTNEESAARLRALGAPMERIHTVGSTALDELIALEPLPRETLEAAVGIELDGRTIVVTYHPATQSDEEPADTMEMLLTAVRDAAPHAVIVVTGSNADAGGAEIDAAAAEVVSRDRRMRLVPSLGAQRYWSLLHHADLVVGNSSSALIEAPVIGVPVVDVGARQRSRLRARSCLHAEATHQAVVSAVMEGLSRVRTPELSPYGDGRAVPRILDLLARIDDPRRLLTPIPVRMTP